MSLQPLGSSRVGDRAVYFPTITKERLVKQFSVGFYHSGLVTDCESVGSVYYNHVIYIRERDEPVPLLAMAFEIADTIPDIGERCLSMVYHGSHYNFGFSRDWLDIDKFTDRAMSIALNHLSVSESGQELPDDIGTGFNLPLLKRSM